MENVYLRINNDMTEAFDYDKNFFMGSGIIHKKDDEGIFWVLFSEENIKKLLGYTANKVIKKINDLRFNNMGLGEFLSLRETADFLKLSPRTVSDYINRGFLKASVIGNKKLISKIDIINLLNDSRG